MRLTDHLEKDSVFTCDEKTFIKCYKKLSQLEDWEEELGIDLTTLFKALKDGIYIKELNNDYPYWGFELRHIKGIGIVIMWGYCSNLFLKDCGKTWSLTKEELL